MARILLLEEDPVLSNLIALVCQDEGYEVEVTRTLAEALTGLSKRRFDLILRDSLVATPEQFFESDDPLLAVPGAPPIVLITGHALDPERLQALGYRGLIRKPFDIDEVAQRLTSLLSEDVTESDR